MEFRLDEASVVLGRTPLVLRALLAGLPRAWTEHNEGDGTWSPFDVVGHLIDGEETDWIPRARIIMESGPAKAFEPFDRFRHQRLNQGRSIDELLDRFERLRIENLATLEELTIAPSDLAREGRHPEFGPVTLEQLLATWVAHDLGHIGQIVRVMAKNYREEAGPWVRYLKVLQG